MCESRHSRLRLSEDFFQGALNLSLQMKMAPVRGAIFLSPIERDLY
jgi:hypothetical protein